MRLIILLLFLAISCSKQTHDSKISQGSIASCGTPRSFGAIPDDGADDRAAIQNAIDSCVGGVVKLERGKYNVVTPYPRPAGVYAMLVSKTGTTLEGQGESTIIEFSGNNGGKDWRGFQLSSSSEYRRFRMTSNFDSGTTVEQTHLMRADGPLRGIHISHLSCNHPAHGAKSGDCIQLVGYPPSDDGSNDKRIWDIEIDHIVFEHSDRSGIAMHSGVHGTQRSDGHYSTRFHDNTFLDISDQSIDGEGSGDIDTVEIDHNMFVVPSNLESAVAVQIQNSSKIHLHDNVLNGRGIDLYGCDNCLLSHNSCTQQIPGAPCVLLRKISRDVLFSDEKYTREVSAGDGPVIVIEQKLTAPERVTIANSSIIQHSDGAAMHTSGIVGLNVLDTNVLYDGTAFSSGINRIDAFIMAGSGASVTPSCRDNGVPSDYPGIRTTDIHIRDTTVIGPYRAAAIVSGSYCGTGTIEITRMKTVGVSQGIRCEGVSTGAGITGPITFLDNLLPVSSCSLLVSP